eukprot:gene23271-30501_t
MGDLMKKTQLKPSDVDYLITTRLIEQGGMGCSMGVVAVDLAKDFLK